jgi:Zn-dependent protease with chaperone function
MRYADQQALAKSRLHPGTEVNLMKIRMNAKLFYWGISLILIILFGIVTVYLLHVKMDVSVSERNGLSDPATYMSADQLKKAEDFSRIRYILYFLQLPYEWGIYLLLLFYGLSGRFQQWADGIYRWSLVRSFFYLFLFTLTTTLLFLPLDLFGFYLSHQYGISTQSLHSWISDQFKSFWVNLLLTLPAVMVLFGLIKKKPKRWWLYAWVLTIPFTLFLYFIQPIILDPIFNDFKPLQDEKLKKEILQLAESAHIPADQVYEVDMSKKTNAMNAYVTGLGSSARIVLWDTALQKLNEREILFVMAHEMGHYVKKHVYWSLLLSILSSFIFFWILHILLPKLVNLEGRRWRFRHMHDIAVYPLILLLASFLSFVSSPVSNWISREIEHSSDLYALELTHDPAAAISSFQKLSAEGLSHPNPPALVRTFIYTHPTIVERIRFAIQYENEQQLK